MRKKVVQKMTALLLTAILCVGLCSDFAVRAEEGDVIAEGQSEQAEADKTSDALTETGQSDISETEEWEQDKPDTEPEESDVQEEQEQPEALEYSEEELQAESEDPKELEQSETWKQMGSVSGASSGLNPPRILTGCDWMRAKQEVTWDCVYFGSYPQSEVLESSDPELYKKLKDIPDGDWDSSKEDYDLTMGDIEIDGNRYRRITQYDASYYSGHQSSEFYPWPANIDYDDYHYFKYEPIKWRVLSVDGTQALLLSDMALDSQAFDMKKQHERTAINWDSKLKNWLNGIDEYEEYNFINDAFTKEQESAIVESDEKIFLLSADEVSGSGEETKKYGFVQQPEKAEDDKDKIDEARLCKSSNYAFAMGTMIDPYEANYPKCNNCFWWLRSEKKYHIVNTEEYYDEGYVYAYVSAVGIVYDDGDWEKSGYYGIRPALQVDLSAVASLPAGQWEKAGTVCSNGTVKLEGEDSGEDTGNSNTGNPSDGSPSDGNPSTGNPSDGNPSDGSPSDGNPSTGSPSDENSSAGTPSTGSPSTGSPSDGSPSAGTPSTGSPSAGTPSTGSSSTGNSSTGNSSTGSSSTGSSSKGSSSTGSSSTGSSSTASSSKGSSSTGSSSKGTTSKKTVKVSKITLSGISKKIAAGKKIKLTAKVSPSKASNKSLTWKSSNKKVATVNSKGVVTLKKNSGGKTVTITATAKDGSKKKATYKITSMKGVVKKVTIAGKGTRTVKAGKTVSLKAKVTASNSKKANKKLKWSSSNTKYATVTSAGKVKTKKAGKGKNVKITATATDGSGKKRTVTIKIR